MVKNYKPKRKKGHLTTLGRCKLYLMHSEGATVEEIASALQLRKRDVKNHLQRNSVLSSPRKPIKPRRKYTAASRSVRGIALSNPRLTARAIAQKAMKKGHNVRIHTVQRILREDGGARYLSVDHVSPLRPNNKVKRLNFSVDMDQKDHSGIIWSDEKWFVVDDQTKKSWVFPSRERLEVTVHAHPLKVMVRGGISKFGRCPLYIFDGNVNSEQYIRALTHCKSWIRSNPKCPPLCKVVLQQDNARPHVSKETQKAAKRLGIHILPNWPPYSPDLNPIEHMWSLMVPIVDTFAPDTIPKLKEAVLMAWDMVSQENVDALVYGTYDQFKKCVEKKGGAINKK